MREFPDREYESSMSQWGKRFTQGQGMRFCQVCTRCRWATSYGRQCPICDSPMLPWEAATLGGHGKGTGKKVNQEW